jgi:SAM-dependent methyltransferase
LFEYKDYGIYRQDLTKNIEGLIPENTKKILVFGDKFHGLEYKWLKNYPERKIINLDNSFKDWNYISDNNPEINLDLEKNSFDIIISYHGIEKSLDPERLILQLRKLLISNGIFIFITYNVSHIYSLYNIMSDELSFKKDGAFKEGHVQHFSYDQMKSFFENTGLQVKNEMIYGVENTSPLSKQVLRITKNPYINALSFIFICKKIETFPFIESVYL